MSAPVDSPALSTQERSAWATRRFCDALGLGVLKAAALKSLSLALVEAALDEIADNRAFAERVLKIFRDLTEAQEAPRQRGGETAKADKPKLTPVGHVDPNLLTPDKPVDPYVLRQLYGDTQLRLALDGYAAATLKRSAAIVEGRNPGTKPVNRGQKASLIDYIVRYVTGQQ